MPRGKFSAVVEMTAWHSSIKTNRVSTNLEHFRVPAASSAIECVLAKVLLFWNLTAQERLTTYCHDLYFWSVTSRCCQNNDLLIVWLVYLFSASGCVCNSWLFDFCFFKCATNKNSYLVLCNPVPIIYTRYWYLDHWYWNLLLLLNIFDDAPMCRRVTAGVGGHVEG